MPPGHGPVVYLSVDAVLVLYAQVYGCAENDAQHYLRNVPGLTSAITRPETYAQYQNADLAMQAAILAHAIAEGQLFVDGNKRTALHTLTTFLRLNGWALSADPTQRAAWMIDLSRGATAEELAGHIRACAYPLSGQRQGLVDLLLRVVPPLLRRRPRFYAQLRRRE